MIPTFSTKTSDRWSPQLSPEGVVDMALRGTREQWWELYYAAQQDGELRKMLVRKLKSADPDLEGGKQLWLALLARMDAAENTTDE